MKLDLVVVPAPLRTIQQLARDAAQAGFERYGGIADRVVSYFAGVSWTQDPQSFERWSQVTAQISP